jgi:membrane associated rhomboid family serine protease
VSDPFGGLAPPPPPGGDGSAGDERSAKALRGGGPERKRPFLPVTYALLTVLGVAFLAEAVVGQDLTVDNNAALFRLGALYLPAVRDGDFWRLGSYAFLHIGWIHILVNGWSMWILLPQLEMAFGSNLALGFFCATAIAGGAASLGWATLHAGHPMLMAGASGGIFGLFGATLAFYYRIRDRFTAEARSALMRSMLFNLLINLGIAFSFPVDNAAHLGGLASGIALGLLAPQRALPKAFWQRPMQWLIVGSVLVLASMEGAAVARAVKPKPRTLRGSGAEAKVEGLFAPVEPGVAFSPGMGAIVIAREGTPPPPGEGQQLAGRTWVRKKSKLEHGDVVELFTEDGAGRLSLQFECYDALCKDDKGDKLIELTARTIRASP